MREGEREKARERERLATVPSLDVMGSFHSAFRELVCEGD